jgi:hypothetical protein
MHASCAFIRVEIPAVGHVTTNGYLFSILLCAPPPIVEPTAAARAEAAASRVYFHRTNM